MNYGILFEMSNIMLTAGSAFSIMLIAIVAHRVGRVYLNEVRTQKRHRTLLAVSLTPPVASMISAVVGLTQHKKNLRPLSDHDVELYSLLFAASERVNFYDMNNVLNGDPAVEEVRRNLIHSLNFLEELAQGIKTDIYDEEVAFERIGFIVPRVYDATQFFITTLRAEGSPFLYTSLEELAWRWGPKRIRRNEMTLREKL